ncbi:MAG TPA: Crp/Fnr family transcriptional regulator [Alphaproteobacteria bacterium]|nr:Crp/Fnr family transcriptional regulator [Alphaproteobacteria bacterium]
MFCQLPEDVLASLQRIKATSVYPKGALLCLEGQPPRGVFILCSGRAKLSTTSAEGKTIILRVAEPGEVLGLTAVVSHSPYEATAETLEPTQANFIPQADFIRFLEDNPEIGAKVTQQLTHNCKSAYEEIRSLGLSASVPEKLARLLLRWSDHPVKTANGTNEIMLRVTLTQEEIAQLVGTSRETVSRVLSDFKKKGWLRVRGTSWAILNKPALRKMVAL